MIPEFDKDTGYLPAGVHDCDWNTFAKRFGTNSYRRRLLRGLLAALQVLKNAHCEAVLIDGSFVTAKPDPGDYDGVWEITSNVRPEWIDPILLKFDDGRKAMKAKYAGELFPSVFRQPNGQTFAEFFQSDRDGKPKGVVRILLRTLP